MSENDLKKKNINVLLLLHKFTCDTLPLSLPALVEWGDMFMCYFYEKCGQSITIESHCNDFRCQFFLSNCTK